MAINMGQEAMEYGKNAVFFVELLVLVVLGRFSRGKIAGYDLNEELTKKDNPAVAISFAGYVLGMLIALMGAFAGDGVNQPHALFGVEVGIFGYNLIGAAVWGVFAIVSLNFARVITDKFLLRGFGNVEELVRDRNIGVGVCEAGAYIASGLIIRSAIAGEGAWWLAPAYVVIGLLLLSIGVKLLLVVVFKSYELEKQIEQDNHAAGVMLGLHILAVGYLINQVIDRNMPADLKDQTGLSLLESFGIELGLSSLFMLVGLVALGLLSVVTDRLMLPADKLKDEIVEDKNIGAAVISGAVAFGGAILVTAIF